MRYNGSNIDTDDNNEQLGFIVQTMWFFTIRYRFIIVYCYLYIVNLVLTQNSHCNFKIYSKIYDVGAFDCRNDSKEKK